jgi:hypothetical protein
VGRKGGFSPHGGWEAERPLSVNIITLATSEFWRRYIQTIAGIMKMFWRWMVVIVVQQNTILKATELLT